MSTHEFIIFTKAEHMHFSTFVHAHNFTYSHYI